MKKVPIAIRVHNENLSLITENDVKEVIAEIIYALVQLIPLGFVTTYGEIAKVLGLSPRYVGKVLSTNRKPIVIPCHRVIMSNRDIGSYTINERKSRYFKRRLLELENVKFTSKGKVSKECIIKLFDVFGG